MLLTKNMPHWASQSLQLMLLCKSLYLPESMAGWQVCLSLFMQCQSNSKLQHLCLYQPLPHLLKASSQTLERLNLHLYPGASGSRRQQVLLLKTMSLTLRTKPYPNDLSWVLPMLLPKTFQLLMVQSQCLLLDLQHQLPKKQLRHRLQQNLHSPYSATSTTSSPSPTTNTSNLFMAQVLWNSPALHKTFPPVQKWNKSLLCLSMPSTTKPGSSNPTALSTACHTGRMPTLNYNCSFFNSCSFLIPMIQERAVVCGFLLTWYRDGLCMQFSTLIRNIAGFPFSQGNDDT